jgi:hypothetical protein
VTATPLAFFTIDRGSASTAVGLIGRLAGRWRLLAATAAPAAIDVDVLLAALVGRVRSADADVLEGADGWREWIRLESRTLPPPAIVIGAPSERRLADLEAAVGDAGWHIAGRIVPDRTDALAATDSLLARRVVGAVVLGVDAVAADERAAAADICALVGAAAARRGDLRVLLIGATSAAAAAFPPGQLVQAPAGPPDAAPSLEAALTGLAEAVAGSDHHGSGAGPASDGRRGFVRSIASLAAILELRIEGIDIGMDAGTRALAGPDGLDAFMIRAEAGLVPEEAMRDDGILDHVVSWAPLHEEPFVLRDRLRNLRRTPWRDAAGDGARLRLAAARAALERLDRAWHARTREAEGGLEAARGLSPDLLVAAGGGFATAPAPAIALAILDTVRQPGAAALALDHARVLGPLGTLEDEADRERLLADLADDLLLPLGSAILVPGARAGKRTTLRLSSDGDASEVTLSAGAVQVVDLPPGSAATAELEADDIWFGVRARHLAVNVAGGLGGLLVDTREMQLRLPDRPDRRREIVEAWEAPLWTGGDG